MFIAILGQRRWGYYFAINAALLMGYFSWRVLGFAGLKELLAKPKETVKVVKKAKKKKARARQKAFLQPRAAWVKVIIAGIAIFFLVFFPNIGKAQALAQEPPLIDEAWYSSLIWLRDNTPEPFGGSDFYYELYEAPFEYPQTAYSVMSWWDYGHWITRTGHRISFSNPLIQNVGTVSSFLIAQDVSSANEMMDKLDTKYVIVDHQAPTSKFYAIPTWAGSSQDEFYETYNQLAEGGKLKPVILFCPAYYRSIVVRLYNFDGKAVELEETLVISYEEKLSKEGVRYKETTGSESFSTYEAAVEYLQGQESGNYGIVSENPFVTPVPLEELKHYKLIHQSDVTTMVAGKNLPEIKTFEYVKRGK